MTDNYGVPPTPPPGGGSGNQGPNPGQGVPNQGWTGGANPYYGAPTPPPYQNGMPGGPGVGGIAQADAGLVNIPGLGTAKVANIGQRFVARLLDGAILTLASWVILGILGAAGAASSSDSNSAMSSTSTAIGGLSLALLLTFPLLMLIYEVIMIAIKGATVGKMIMGIKVVSSANGGRPGFAASAVRSLIPILGFVLCYLGEILVYLSPLFDSSGRMQGWHDRAANDLVISTR